MSEARRAERQMIANRAAVRLVKFETLIDQALQEVGALCAELPNMRQEASLSAVFGQDIFQAAGGAYAGLVEARGKAVHLHTALEGARQNLGLRPVAASGGDKPPPDATAVAA